MGEDGITISDKKQVKIEGVFEEADLLSEEEKAAMEEDTAAEDAAAEKAAQASADPGEAEKAAQAAKEEADEQKAKEIEEADKKIAEEKAAAGEKAAAAAAETEGDKEAKTSDEDGEQASSRSDQEAAVSQTPPPVMMDTLSQEQIDELTNKLEDNEKKFQDGEIDYKEYFDGRLLVERQLWQNEMAVQLSADGVESQWQWEQSSFLAGEENAWINDDDVVYSAFAATVNRIMSTEEGETMPGPQILAQAREEVAARFSPTKLSDDAEASAEAKKAKALKGAKKAQGEKPLPQTLAKVPPAEQEEGELGEFDWIDKLDGEAYEKAVEGLSEVQLARYADSK